MKKKVLVFISLLIICCTLFTSKAYAYTTISPVNNVYKEGIYRLDDIYKDKYNLMYQFNDKSKQSTIIILDEDFDTKYKNINCQRKCNAGTITNKDTIIIVGESEVSLYFDKVQ